MEKKDIIKLDGATIRSLVKSKDVVHIMYWLVMP